MKQFARLCPTERKLSYKKLSIPAFLAFKLYIFAELNFSTGNPIKAWQIKSRPKTIQCHDSLSPGQTQTNRGVQGRLTQTMNINALLHNHLHTVYLTLVVVIGWIDYQSIYI